MEKTIRFTDAQALRICTALTKKYKHHSAITYCVAVGYNPSKFLHWGNSKCKSFETWEELQDFAMELLNE